MKLLRYIYTNNPFYLISALLVLFGLYRLFPAEDPENAWPLLGSICVYATLLAVTAVLIIRFGKVWEDARSILLVIILMFLALAASFDERLIVQPGPGCALLIGGLVFSVLVSEALLRSLGMRLPVLFRASYYLLLGVFFLYPLLLTGLVFFASRDAVGRGAFLFATVMGVASLSLIPAVRRGREYVRASGTPWSWPWYPWTLFGFLALGVCGRAYYLTLTFGAGPGDYSAFAPYYLIPFLLATAVLVLEIGIIENSSRIRRFAMIGPLSFLLLAAFGLRFNPASEAFLASFVAGVGSPLFLTVCTLVAYYAYAALRGVRGSPWYGFGVLTSLSVVRPETVDPTMLAAPSWIPLAIVTGVLAWIAHTKKESLHYFVAIAAALATATVAWSDSWFTAVHGALPLHLLLAAAMFLGALVDDRWSRWLRGIGTCLVSLYFATVLALQGTPILAEHSPVVVASYLSLLLLVQLAYWYGFGSLFHLFLVAGNTVVGLGTVVWKFRRVLLDPSHWPRGLLNILTGLAFLLLATGISLAKAGLFRSLTPRNSKPPPRSDGDL